MTEPPHTAMTTLEIVKTLVLPSAPSRVWKALTDPDELVQWFPDERADIEAERPRARARGRLPSGEPTDVRGARGQELLPPGCAG